MKAKLASRKLWAAIITAVTDGILHPRFGTISRHHISMELSSLPNDRMTTSG